MKLLSYLACFCAAEGFALGLLALVLDPRSTVNRLAAAAGFAYAGWALGMTFAYGSENPEVAVVAYRLSFWGSLATPPLLTWIYLRLADGSTRARTVVVASSFAWAALAMGHYLAEGFYYQSFVPGPWSNVGVPSQNWLVATVSPYVQSAFVVFAVLVWSHHARRRGSQREKRQLALLVPAVVTTIAVDFGAWALEVWAGLPNAMVLAGAVLISATFVVIARSRLLLPDRPLLERHLFHVSQDSGFFLDPQGLVLGANGPALQRWTGPTTVVGRDFRGFLDDTVLFEREWRLVTGRQANHRRLLVPLGGHTVAVTLAARFDEFHDLVGVGVLVGDLAGFDERARAWGITPREKEVLLLAVQDTPLDDIADALGIAPTTVRTHLHHLCEKTGCANRVELFGRLLQPSED